MKKSKKSMSELVSSVLMIVLVVVLVGVIWGVVNGMVRGELDKTSCFGNIDKVNLNEAYTCYNSTSKELYFSIKIGDISVDKVLVSISDKGDSNSITLDYTNQTINDPYVNNYPLNNTGVVLPNKNGGKTYIMGGFSSVPDLISIAPVIDGETCQESYSISEIETCSSY